MRERAAFSSRPLWLASLVLFVALAVLRLQVMHDLEVDVARGWALGLGIGLAYDALLALVPLVAAELLWGVFLAPRWVTWSTFALAFWLANAANVTYFRYFGGRLSAWAIQHHAADLFAVRGAAGSLALTPTLVASVAALIALAIFSLRRRGAPAGRPSRDLRLARGWIGVALSLTLALGLVSLSTWKPRLGTILNDQIVFLWAKTGFGEWRATSNDRKHRAQVSRMLAGEEAPSAGAVLASFRDLGTPEPVPPVDDRFPLVRWLRPEVEEVEALRAQLGLPVDRSPNIAVLFLESVRALEVHHPEIGPIVFPELRRVLSQHGWDFRQAYSSSVGAGLTVRGQFSTLCSLLPNLRGAATYVARYSLQARCLAELARENGYQTYWVSSQDKDFHHKEIFEALHGTDHFYDYDFFRGLGLQKNFDNCGIADGPFLASYVALLEELGEDPRPFFVNTLTISTHVPHTVLPDVELPASLTAGLEDERAIGYLTRLRYLDDALGAFFDAFFASPVSNDTVIVLLGDHGLKVHPAIELAPHQRIELLARIPLAVVTRGMVEPRVIDEPVHQVDVAPTIARIAGFDGWVTWLGRPLDGGAGTPWIMDVGGRGLQYRVGDRACYRTAAREGSECYDVSDGDPLLVSELRPVPERPEETLFFDRVMDAQAHVILRDEVAPANPEPPADALATAGY